MLPRVRADTNALRLLEHALAGDDNGARLAAQHMDAVELRSAALFLANCYSGVLADQLGSDATWWAVVRLRQEVKRVADERPHGAGNAGDAAR
jgi:hypothetical protein